MRRLSIFIVVCCIGCKTGEIACPVIIPLKLRHTSHYKINPVRKSQPVMANADDRKNITFRVREVKELESIEEWDCPKPGMNKTPKFVQRNIKANKKKLNSYYKNKNQPDSTRINFSLYN